MAVKMFPSSTYTQSRPHARPTHLDVESLTPLAALICQEDDGQARTMLTVRAPFTNDVIGQVPQCLDTDVERAYQRARAAQADWAAQPFAVRRKVALRFHEVVFEHQDVLLDLVQLETGKARQHALDEVFDLPHNVRHYAFHGDKLLRTRNVRTQLPIISTTAVQRVPVGVVAFITPWNYPLAMTFSDLFPALLAGNAVVLKPSELTPYTALYTANLLFEAGLPRDLLQIVTGHGAPISEALIQNADFVNFTGSTATGRRIAARAAASLTGVSLELGGKNPMLVLADADVQRAVDCAVAASFANSGQLCISIERIYVQRTIYDDFVKRMAAATRQMRLTAQYDYSADMGSLVGQAQLDKTIAHVEDARQKGATIIAGGETLPELGPYFYAPTVLTGVTPQMTVYHEETFGPVVALYPFDSVEDAVQRANESAYGLNASIWTRNGRLANQIASKIQCGTVNINEGFAATWSSIAAPMGGMKQSGLGRRHGPAGILKFTEERTVTRQRMMPVHGPRWLPRRIYQRAIAAMLQTCRRVPGWR